MINISFVSGTRADYGKIKPYIDFLTTQPDKKVSVFVTGMNMLKKHGMTYQFIQKDLGKKCPIYLDKGFKSQNTALETAHIIQSFDAYLKKEKIDFVFVHGDRPEVLATTTASVFNNIPVCHIEAGDLSGSVDESIRHATSKLSHQFLVADENAKEILLKMGEDEHTIHITGNSSLAFQPTPLSPQEQAQIDSFKNYAILIYHPVTTVAPTFIQKEISDIMTTLKDIGKETIVISPNNDLGNEAILETYHHFKKTPNFHFVQSFSFSAFYHLLQRADFLIGNSSCGIKEAPYYHTPVIDIGCRQFNRFHHLKLKHFHHIDTTDGLQEIIQKIEAKKIKRIHPNYRDTFMNNLKHIFTTDFFKIKTQKKFNK